LDKQSILNTLKQIKIPLSNYGIIKLGLFGSYVREEAQSQSDVDILIDFSKNTETTIFDIIEIEELLTSTLNKKVDLALMSKLKTNIAKHILNEVEFV